METIQNNDKFYKYYNFLIQENEKYNLTNITNEKEVFIKHFYDSIQLDKAIDMNSVVSLCDVGSGAGFPSIPLKLIYPNLHVTIIEPTLKRCNFLKQLVELLELKNVNIINDRAENILKYRDYFDIVCARAVANLRVLCELCIPLVKVEGLFLAMKGSQFEEELNETRNALKELDASLVKVYEYDLPSGNGHHSIIAIKKNKKTNKKYPRNYSTIKKKPL